MIKPLSYIYPITKKVSSQFNGTLEITWFNGKKYLNTKNANYSYGSLQKVLKIGLQKIDLSICKNILLLGMGGGSVIETLRTDFNYQKNITAVEIDPVVIKIAEDEFSISENKTLKIICEDAQLFMQLNTRKFDLIITDLYIDTTVPSPFLETPFWQDLINTSPIILCNASIDLGNENKVKGIVRFLTNHNHNVDRFDRVNDTNTLIIANSKQS